MKFFGSWAWFPIIFVVVRTYDRLDNCVMVKNRELSFSRSNVVHIACTGIFSFLTCHKLSLLRLWRICKVCIWHVTHKVRYRRWRSFYTKVLDEAAFKYFSKSTKCTASSKEGYSKMEFCGLIKAICTMSSDLRSQKCSHKDKLKY